MGSQRSLESLQTLTRAASELQKKIKCTASPLHQAPQGTTQYRSHREPLVHHSLDLCSKPRQSRESSIRIPNAFMIFFWGGLVLFCFLSSPGYSGKKRRQRIVRMKSEKPEQNSKRKTILGKLATRASPTYVFRRNGWRWCPGRCSEEPVILS